MVDELFSKLSRYQHRQHRRCARPYLHPTKRRWSHYVDVRDISGELLEHFSGRNGSQTHVFHRTAQLPQLPGNAFGKWVLLFRHHHVG